MENKTEVKRNRILIMERKGEGQQGCVLLNILIPWRILFVLVCSSSSRKWSGDPSSRAVWGSSEKFFERPRWAKECVFVSKVMKFFYHSTVWVNNRLLYARLLYSYCFLFLSEGLNFVFIYLFLYSGLQGWEERLKISDRAHIGRIASVSLCILHCFR